MNLKDLAKEPTLVKITLDDETTVANYGEPVEFYTWDRQPMDVYLRMATIDASNTEQVFESIKTLVLDEAGKPILDKSVGLPPSLLLLVLNTIVEQMGK